MQQKLNLMRMICLQIWKIIKTKPHQVDFRSLLSRVHYYQSQAVTSINDEDQEALWLQNSRTQRRGSIFRKNNKLGHFLHMFSLYDDS